MTKKKLSLSDVFPYLLVIGGIIGLVSSLILSYDTLQVVHNTHYVPACNLNPVLSCGSVINAPGDKIFGLPYPFYGIAAFAVLLTTGVGMLAGAVYKKWYWLGFQLAAFLGLVGAYYLLIKSVYSIHALCPFCLTVDVVVTTLFWYLTMYNIDNKVISFKNKKATSTFGWIRKHHLDLLVVWFLIVIALILKHFWYYYGQFF